MIDNDLLQEMAEFLKMPAEFLKTKFEAESGRNGFAP